MAKPNPYLKKATGSSKTPAPAEPKKRHGLGRGLDSLIPTAAQIPQPVSRAVAASEAPVAAGQVLELPILDIERSPYQPRRDFKDEELRELAESLKNNGLVQPPSVRRNSRGKWELIAGERRLRAAQFAGWTKIQVVVREADDQTAAIMTATENLQREDLNPIEEAQSYKTLQEKFNLTQAEIAEKVGKGRATVANATRLLELPDEVKALVQTALLSAGHAKVLLSLDNEKDRILFARECVNEQLTVRALERKVARRLTPVPPHQHGTPDLPAGYVKNLVDQMKKQLGCAVRVTPGITHENGRHTKGVVEIDFLTNDDLDRVISMLGVRLD